MRATVSSRSFGRPLPGGKRRWRQSPRLEPAVSAAWNERNKVILILAHAAHPLRTYHLGTIWGEAGALAAHRHDVQGTFEKQSDR